MEPVPGISGGRLDVRPDRHRHDADHKADVPRGPETSWNFFHPGARRCALSRAVGVSRRSSHAIDPAALPDVVWHAVHERWTVWVKNPRIRHWMCAGWQLLFPVRYPDGSYLPLDARVLATIYDRSPRKWENGRRYFDRIVDEVRRDIEAGQRNRGDCVGQIARDQWRHCHPGRLRRLERIEILAASRGSC